MEPEPSLHCVCIWRSPFKELAHAGLVARTAWASGSVKKPARISEGSGSFRWILDPTSNEFLQVGTDTWESGQRPIFLDQLRCFFWPKEGAARGTTQSLLKWHPCSLGVGGQKLGDVRVAEELAGIERAVGSGVKQLSSFLAMFVVQWFYTEPISCNVTGTWMMP
jgi:hypothetical protein